MVFANVTSQNKTQILRAKEEHLPAIFELAGVIWRACYPGIITSAQIDYMLARMYSLDVLRDEIRSQGIRYDQLLVDGKPAGFASYSPTSEPSVMKLHKLYLLPEMHGRGLGSRLLQHVEREVRAGAGRRLILSVNKRNTKAITAYQRNGFVIAESVITDIGGGFVMDDFVMAKELPGLTACEFSSENKPSSRKVRPENHPDASDKTV
jgi:GNAT superfamily N-acetyltransferase